MDNLSMDMGLKSDTAALEDEIRQLKQELREAKNELEKRDCRITDIEDDFGVKMGMFQRLAEDNERHLTSLMHLVNSSEDFHILANNELNVAFCSDSFLRKIGKTRYDNIEDINLLDIYREFTTKETLEELTNKLTVATVQDETSRHDIVADLDGSGEFRTYRVTNTPMIDKNIDGVVINWNDITDITDAKNRAEEASKAKSDFLSKMSHEIRTPIGAIIGMTSIGRKAKEIEKKNYALDKVEEASKHLLDVINDVLDIAKIEANKLELASVEFDFEKMLQKVLTVARYRVDEKQQILRVNVDTEIPRYVISDDKRLAQIMTNLLSNAVKFTPVGGEISLDITLLGETDGVCTLRICVTDSGIGISPEQQKRLFQAFEQADSGTSRKYGGTGLGLVITQNIIELMGGKISVESEIGKGAKFTFEVNIQRGGKGFQLLIAPDSLDADGDMESDAITENEFQGKRLLLAEDNEINREILIALLDGSGLIIDCVENGQDALTTIEENPTKYNLVFMDLQMPIMDGLEATRNIRALPVIQNRELPIIAMSANVSKDDIDACITAGMDDHLGKPLDIDRVLEKMRYYFKSS